jgi:KDO2-lipid IV(A) lauroyltransferase
MKVLPLTGEERVYRSLVERLRAGGMVCLVADRDLTAGGVDVRFFGETARMPAGPASLVRATGALLLPVTLWYDARQLVLRINEEVPVPSGGTRGEQITAMTQQVASVFEAGIREHPEDWHMLQPLWLADLRGRHPQAAPR